MEISKILLSISIIIIILFNISFNFIIKLDSSYIEKSESESSISLSSTTESKDTTSSSTTEPKDTIKSNNNQIYEHFFDFPYDDMVFSDDETFKIIKEIYEEFDFSSEFKQGNLDTYDFYKEKYNQLLNNKIKFIDRQANKEFYINEYNPIKIDTGNSDNYYGEYDANYYTYYFFDIDEDNTPELCMFDASIGTYIFKYISDLNKMILWNKFDVHLYQIIGSKTVIWDSDGRYFAIYKLNEDGEEINSINFIAKDHYNTKLEKSEMVFMVSLPQNIDKEKQIEINELAKNQGYFSKDREIYYFRFTEIQFDELTKDYSNALETALKNIKDVTFTYDTLFNK